MNRRSLMVMLIGVIAALSGFAAAAWVQQERCEGAGGLWRAAIRRCQLPDGTSTGWSLAAVLTGLVTAVVAGIVLFRAMQFVTERSRTRSPG